MQTEERKRLAEAAEKNDYMSIAINDSDKPVRSGFVPWEKTATAFNMKTPKITLSIQDLEDESIRSDLKKCCLTGIYIFTGLPDYRFLRDFGQVRDLFILHGENIKDLSFVSHMPELFMIYLEEVSVPDLVPLIESFNKGKSLPGKCIGLYKCRVEDTSALNQIRFCVSEFLVWPVEGDSKERWKITNSRVGTYRYYS